MNRDALLRYLTQYGCRLKREGGSHSIWVAPDGKIQAIPRHREVADLLARSICRKLGLPDPSRKE